MRASEETGGVAQRGVATADGDPVPLEEREELSREGLAFFPRPRTRPKPCRCGWRCWC